MYIPELTFDEWNTIYRLVRLRQAQAHVNKDERTEIFYRNIADEILPAIEPEHRVTDPDLNGPDPSGRTISKTSVR